jgi:4-amino-4-deoxy-L-arabinose transferase-like glycosyltransferase
MRHGPPEYLISSTDRVLEDTSMTTMTLPPSSVADSDPVRVAEPPATTSLDPLGARPALFVLLYLWDLSASGYANSFYSAAAQAGSQSWKAFFFGSSDSSNFITVDKPPASLWAMELSARIFGVNSWSILVPEVLMGVASVGVLYTTVKRWFGPAAGLIAGAVLALTPVAVLMFRFNNPDALLVLLLVGAAYAVTRAVEDGRTRWLMLASVLIGTGFITKMMQAFLVVPGFALVFLVCAPGSVRKRLLQLLAAGAALVVASLWWVVAVMAIPAADRPYIGGSQNNSLWNLIFGYNGFGRITGNETGSVGGGGGNAGGRWGATGWGRMFNASYGGQISWLIPAALVLLVGGVWLAGTSPRTNRLRAGLGIWGTWLVVTGLTFSFASGIIHEYYSVALAPAIGALVGIGGVSLWRERGSIIARGFLAVALLAGAWWSYDLLDRSSSWLPWLRVVVLVVGLAVVAGLAGPLAYSLNTVRTPHTGSLPTAGPAVATAFGGRGGAPGAAGARGFGGGGFGGPPPGTQNGPGPQNGFAPGTGGILRQPGGGTGGNGGLGGLLNASSASSELVAALKANASQYTWVLATTGANSAAGYQLASGEPVMAIGGFNGTDPTPTLAQFQAYVTAGKIHYYIASGQGGGGMGTTSSYAGEIASWVEANYTATTIGGTTVYDLTAATAS